MPYRFVGQPVKFIYSQHTVEIYHQYERVATHQRTATAGQYTTLRDHLHPHHQWLSQYSPAFFQDQADKVGSFTRQFIDQLLASRSYAEQAYRSCAGVLSLKKKYGADRLEMACQRALHYQATSYRFVRTILERDMDRLELADPLAVCLPQVPVLHENIRGAQHYQ